MDALEKDNNDSSFLAIFNRECKLGDRMNMKSTLEVKIPMKASEIRMSLNYKEICRFCLLEDSDMSQLSTTEDIEGQSRTISEILMSISNVQIAEDDGLSNVICADCLKSARFANCFKLQCEQAEIVFKKYFSMIDNKIMIEPKVENEHIEFIFSDADDDISLACYNSVKLGDLPASVDKVDNGRDSDKSGCQFQEESKILKDENKTTNGIQNVVSEMTRGECTICGKTVRNMKQHLKRHTGRHFTCEMCGKSYSSHYDLNNHLKTHSKERPFKCKVCFKGFCHVYRLKEHMLGHANKRDYICELCGKRFNVSKRLIVHMRVHSGHKPYTCSVCPKTYSSSEKLKIHVLGHTGEKRFVCDYCSKAFVSKELLKTHLRIHTGERPYSCDMTGCDRRFSTQHGLLMHKPVHSDERPYPCLTCGKRFARASDWRKHEAIHLTSEDSKLQCPQPGCQRTYTNSCRLKEHLTWHLTDKRALCTSCGKSFTRKSDLTRHARIHTQERPFKCTECGLGFNQQFGLTQHLRKHTGECHFICDLCGKGFNRKCSLEKHKMVHSGIKNYKCGECDMKFTDSSQLLRHKRIHSGERPYKCELCDKSFSARSGYVVHLRAHTGEKPYQCHFCDKACATSTALKIHMRYHTGEKPYLCPQCGASFTRSDLRNIHMKICCPDTVAEPVNQTSLKYFLHQKSSGANFLQVIPQMSLEHETNGEVDLPHLQASSISLVCPLNEDVLEQNLLPSHDNLMTSQHTSINHNNMMNLVQCDQSIMSMEYGKQ